MAAMDVVSQQNELVASDAPVDVEAVAVVEEVSVSLPVEDVPEEELVAGQTDLESAVVDSEFEVSAGKKSKKSGESAEELQARREERKAKREANRIVKEHKAALRAAKQAEREAREKDREFRRRYEAQKAESAKRAALLKAERKEKRANQIIAKFITIGEDVPELILKKIDDINLQCIGCHTATESKDMTLDGRYRHGLKNAEFRIKGRCTQCNQSKTQKIGVDDVKPEVKEKLVVLAKEIGQIDEEGKPVPEQDLPQAARATKNAKKH